MAYDDVHKDDEHENIVERRQELILDPDELNCGVGELGHGVE